MVKTARKEGLMDFYVGIDVSKFKHTVAIIDEEGEIRKKSFDISNSREGFSSLLNELGLLGEKEQIKIGMEATGHYMNCLVRCLISNGYQAQIYNPSLISKFRDSESVNLAKTDNLDAMLIAKYVATHPFTSSPQLSYLIGEIRKISRAKYFLFGDCCGHPSEMKYIITLDFVQMLVLIMSHMYTHQDSIKSYYSIMRLSGQSRVAPRQV